VGQALCLKEGTKMVGPLFNGERKGPAAAKACESGAAASRAGRRTAPAATDFGNSDYCKRSCTLPGVPEPCPAESSS
jgi:hypothetical protein